MAGHIQDRWYKSTDGPDGKPMRVKTERYGVGLRYRARYVGPDGTEKSKSFPDKQKRQAEAWLSNIATDMSRGDYIESAAGKVTFAQYVSRWLTTQTTDLSTRQAVEMRLRLHAVPYMGTRPLASFQPSDIRLWMRALEDTGLSAAYRRGIFAHSRPSSRLQWRIGLFGTIRADHARSKRRASIRTRSSPGPFTA